MKRDETTEEKIKETARLMFIKKGFVGTKTRDIAKEAGINLALVNYYFRSKKQLFKQIMMESLKSFFASVVEIFNDPKSSIEEKFTQLSDRYIEKLSNHPDIPMFILTEIRSDPQTFLSEMLHNIQIHETVIFKQIAEKMGKEQAKKIHPFHIMMNLMGLILFPFIAKSMVQHVVGLQDDEFAGMMEQRKKMIPIWIMQMIAPGRPIKPN